MPEISVESSNTLWDVLQARAHAHPTKLAYRFLEDGEQDTGRLTYHELMQSACAVAAGLTEGLPRGSRVLLAHPPGLEFLVCLWGCWAAGMIPVPTAAPFGKRARARAESIVNDAWPAMALTTNTELQSLARWIDGAALDVKAMATPFVSGASTVNRRVAASEIALLQYTSGSTSAPKGVVVQQQHLLASQRMIALAMNHSELADFVSWLPHFHDMGLIGNLLQPIFIGSTCTFMPPAAFLRKPARWLGAISRYRAHTSGAPNFAFDLCADAADDPALSGLDLSCWKVAYDGAEPVQEKTLRRFAQAFAPAGFAPRAFYPTFGLAEATLMVSGAHWQTAATTCGFPLAPQKVAIVEPATQVVLGERAIGEIWIQGPNVCAGYWQDEALTRERFHAFTAGGEGPFLRTGDLGYFQQGELIISGRLKDQLIVRGINFDPHDVETAAADVLNARRAVVAIQDERDAVVLVCEAASGFSYIEAESAATTMAQAVATALEIELQRICFVRAATVPRTSSGKVRRAQCRRDLLSGRLQILQTVICQKVSAPSGESLKLMSVEERFAVLLRYLTLRVAGDHGQQLDAHASLASFGGDSLTALSLVHELESQFGVNLPERLSLDEGGLHALARCLAEGFEHAPARMDSSGEKPGTALSIGQQGFWFMGQLAPLSSALNLYLAAYVDPVEDIALLRRCLESSLSRHRILSTRIQWIDGVLHQVSSDPPCVAVLIEDCPTEHVQARATEIAHRPFDLNAEPPARAQVLQCAGSRCAIVLVVHHLAADFRSLCILLRDALSMYRQAHAGQPMRRRDTVPSFSRFVQAEQELLGSKRGEELVAYWKSQLAGEITPLELPFAAKVSAVTNDASAGLCHHRIDPRLAQGLRELAARNGCTLYVTMLAIFAALLHRYTSRADILVGSPAGLRADARFAETVGYLVNVLPLRFDASGDPFIKDFMRHVREVVSRGIEHVNLPVARIVESIDLTRDASTTPLIQMLFSWQKAPFFHEQGLTGFALRRPGARADLDAMHFEQLPLPPADAQYDLTLMLGEDSADLWTALEFRQALFGSEIAQRVLLDFERFAACIVRSEDVRLSQVPLIDASLRMQLLRQTNGPPASAAKAASVGERFRQIATGQPHRIALVAGNEHFSYAMLDRLSDALAARLMEEGIEIEQSVALIAPLSAHLLIGMLGALKAGVAYLPVDPNLPPARQQQMISEARCVALLYGRGISMEINPPTKMISIETACRKPGVARRRIVEGRNAAYYIYTSGSTGTSKCVVVEHAALLNLFAAFESWCPGSSRGLRWTVFHAATFDLSAWEIFGAWLCGGQLVIVGPEARCSSVQLAKLITQKQIEVLSLTPSTLQALLAVWPESPTNAALLRLAVGGEPTTPELAARVLARKLPAWNFYGPTEATVWTAACELSVHEGNVMVGGPIAGTRVSVVDRQLDPAPESLAGEIAIGGVGLARGYHRRPAATAFAFRPDPDGERGSRLYCTGDRAALTACGLKFLGRKDRQIKLRGFRADLVEIERVLLSARGVAQAAAVASGDTQAAQHLVCFIVPSADVDAEYLVEWLRSQLPAYMVPSAVVPLDTMPCNRHGKVDYAALTALVAQKPVVTATQAPTAETEERVRKIWLRVLQIPAVGAHENFFDVGGHSLAMTHVLQHLNAELACPVSLIDLYRGATVFEHARLIEGARKLQPREPSEDIRSRRLLARNKLRERTLQS